MWEALMQDLRYAVRALRRSPGFTLIAVVTLALGIGANTAIFSVVNGVLLRPLPYTSPDRLVRLYTSFGDTKRYSMSQPEFMDYKGLGQVFENAAAFTGTTLTLTGDGEPERLTAMAVTRDLLPVLGVTPLFGRNFEGQEGRAGVEARLIEAIGRYLPRRHAIRRPVRTTIRRTKRCPPDGRGLPRRRTVLALRSRACPCRSRLSSPACSSRRTSSPARSPPPSRGHPSSGRCSPA